MRLHLFEFEDFRWLPEFLRNAITEYLGLVIRLSGCYEPVVSQLSAALARTGESRIVDLCSGAGGPWPRIFTALRAQNPGLRLRLSDYFPNHQARAVWKAQTDLDYISEPVNASNVPSELQGFRTLFTSFHHFTPAQAKEILRDAVSKRRGIGIFEMTERSVQAVLWMSLSPWAVLLLTPWVRPFRATRWIFTYIVPLIPLLITFDAVASCLRTYSVDELRALASSVDGDYHWEVGQIRAKRSFIPTTYLVGTPKERG